MRHIRRHRWTARALNVRGRRPRAGRRARLDPRHWPLLWGRVCQAEFDRGIRDPSRRWLSRDVGLLASVIWIRGWGLRSVRASARTNFYPCRTGRFGTRCSIRAERVD